MQRLVERAQAFGSANRVLRTASLQDPSYSKFRFSKPIEEADFRRVAGECGMDVEEKFLANEKWLVTKVQGINVGLKMTSQSHRQRGGMYFIHIGISSLKNRPFAPALTQEQRDGLLAFLVKIAEILDVKPVGARLVREKKHSLKLV